MCLSTWALLSELYLATFKYSNYLFQGPNFFIITYYQLHELILANNYVIHSRLRQFYQRVFYRQTSRDYLSFSANLHHKFHHAIAVAEVCHFLVDWEVQKFQAFPRLVKIPTDSTILMQRRGARLWQSRPQLCRRTHPFRSSQQIKSHFIWNFCLSYLSAHTDSVNMANKRLHS